MPLPLAASLAMSFGPALLGGLFGRGGQQGIPDWFKPYLDDYMKSVIGKYDELIAGATKKNKVEQGLKQEALAAVGKGPYAGAGFGPLGSHVLNNLKQRQAASGKAANRQVEMSYAAAGLNTGLLQNVKAQMENERTQANEMANSEAVSNVALGSVNSFNQFKNAQRDYLAQLVNARANAYGNVLNAAGRIGGQPSPPGIASRILTGVAAAAPGIVAGLGSGGANPPTHAPVPNVNFPAPIPGGITGIPGGGFLTTAPPNIATPAATPTSAVPANFNDWWKKYGKGATYR